MVKYIVEIENKSGQIKKRTIDVPRNVDNIRDYFSHKMHLLIEPEKKYRHTSGAFWREWSIYQTYRV